MNNQTRFQQTITDYTRNGGPSDSITSETFDDSGRLVAEAVDNRADGIVDTFTTYTYDFNGNPSSKFIDYARGAFNRDYSLLSDYSYDNAGNLTITYTDGADNSYSLGDYVYSFNTNGDPLIRLSYSENQEYTYNEAGQITSFQDNPPFGSTPSSARTYTYNEAGQLDQIVRTSNGEQTGATTNRYNPAGQLANVIETSNGEQVSIVTNTYDEAGNLLVVETTNSDGSGTVTNNRYDAAGNLIEALTTPIYTDDGSDDPYSQYRLISETLTYAYDDAGNLTQETVDERRVFGVNQSTVNYEYDEVGNRTQVARDFGSDGRTDLVENFVYDADGNVVYQETDNGPGYDWSNRSITRNFFDVVPGPVAVDDAIASENDILLVGNVFADNGSGRDTDPKGGPPKVTEINGIAAIGNSITLDSGAQVRVEENGLFVYDPGDVFQTLRVGDFATDSFTYTIADILGNTDTATANVTLKGANKPKVATPSLRQSVTDRDGDGIPESIRTFTYDEAGNLIREVHSDNYSGSPTGILSRISSITTYTYDEAGNQTSETNDYNGNGIPNRRSTFTYDEAGNQLSAAYDNNGDGIVNYRSTFTYDEAGNQTSNTYDNDGDGIADSIDTYTYDANGNQTSRTYDNNGDGIADSINTYTYDANGNQTSSANDDDGDGVVDSISRTGYDAAGNVINQETDSDADGILESISTSTYDEAGTLIGDTRDYNGDGILEYLLVSTFDAAGNRTAQASSYDLYGDGQLTSTSTEIYNPQGDIILQANDNNGDGVADTVTASIYTYDEAGNRISEATDRANDGVIDSIFTSTYDEAGNRTSNTFDTDADGIVETTYLYTYDEAGNQLSELLYDGDINGVLSRSITYDSEGNPLSGFSDYDGDGVFNNVVTNFYIAPSTEPNAPEDGLYTYDAAGNLTIAYAIDDNDDDIVVNIFTYTFDTAGNQIGESRDYGANGEVDYVLNSSYSYDEFGSLTISHTADDNGDGKIDNLLDYFYNSAGQLLSITQDFGADGQIDVEEVLDYVAFSSVGSSPMESATLGSSADFSAVSTVLGGERNLADLNAFEIDSML